MYNRFIALDFETANNSKNSACALSIVTVENLIITEQYYSLIKPPKNYFIYTETHGITWDDVKSSPTFNDIWPDIQKYFKEIDFIAAHNSSFDRLVMEACCKHYGLISPRAKYKCTLQLSRKKLKLESHALDKVCLYYGIELEHHNALSDTLACAKIMINLFGDE
jgi:DNA polymerase-3 subunit epsilon